MKALSARPGDFVTRPETALLHVPRPHQGDTAGLFPGYLLSALGLFALFGQFSSDLRRSQVESGAPGMNHESILELNYQYNVTPWFYLQPDVQGVLRPNGTGRVADSFVMAMQIGVTL